MTSELRVNTLKDDSGNNSVPMEYVANGSAKAWINYNGTGTISARDSLNVGSISDEGTGDYDINLISSMNNDDYCVTCGAGRNSASAAAGFQPPNNLTTSQYNISSTDSGGAATDFEQPMSQIVGDLA